MLYVAVLLQPGAPISTPAQASIPTTPVQASVSVPAPAVEPGYASPFSNSASGGTSYSLAEIELNLDPNCECLGFF
jgi:hypothetical protein